MFPIFGPRKNNRGFVPILTIDKATTPTVINVTNTETPIVINNNATVNSDTNIDTSVVTNNDTHIIDELLAVDNFEADISLPTIPALPRKAHVNPTMISRIFNKKHFQLYKTCSGDNIVVNLSTMSLSEIEKDVLSKGLTFCPTEGEPNFGQLWSDLKLFFRRLRIKQFFSLENSQHDPMSPMNDTFIATQDNRSELEKHIDMKFKNKSNWEPPQGDHALETFIQSVTNDFGKMSPKKPLHPNLTKDQSIALTKLSQNTSIVIKKADKGAAVVIMNREDYITEAERQLSDQNFYIETPDDLTEPHCQKNNFLFRHNDNNQNISEKVF